LSRLQCYNHSIVSFSFIGDSDSKFLQNQTISAKKAKFVRKHQPVPRANTMPNHLVHPAQKSRRVIVQNAEMCRQGLTAMEKCAMIKVQRCPRLGERAFDNIQKQEERAMKARQLNIQYAAGERRLTCPFVPA
jgi:hypothetical protein